MSDVTGPYFAWLPVSTFDRGRLWMRRYWASGLFYFADESKALRYWPNAQSYFEARKTELEKAAEVELAKFDALPEDAKREHVIERLKADGAFDRLQPHEIKAIIEGNLLASDRRRNGGRRE
jgi:hypothetical protein